jgi:hypothetical protein
MSIISTFETDDSALMAKRFAALATSYLDDPKKAKSRTAQVPLENLYRLLEMFRYTAFADEGRRGVLALDSARSRPTGPSPTTPNWHEAIATAIQRALDQTFAATPKGAALDEVERGLRTLATKGVLPPAEATKVRKFLSTLEGGLG